MTSTAPAGPPPGTPTPPTGTATSAGARTDAGAPTPAATAMPFEVDWDQAARWAGRLAPPGPTASRGQLQDLVGALHDAAVRARPLALRAARLSAAVRASGTREAAQVIVVDRPGWARAAGQSFEAMTPAPDAGTMGLGRLRADVRSVPATTQAAALLGLLSSRVLGQFDPFALAAPAGGRLLLVAPNILKTEVALRAEPRDFRLWVCIHEQTHALQFAAAPWLAGHLRHEVGGLVADLAASAGDEMTGALEAIGRAARQAAAAGSGRRGTGDGRHAEDAGIGDLGVLELVLDPDQRRRVERITAVMSLLEGHADVTMDAVGERAIPSVRRLRARFEARRRSATGLDRVLRRLLGMDAKLAQYRRGAAFVRGVREAGGRGALDAVWSDPQSLPTPQEITDPQVWLQRVHG